MIIGISLSEARTIPRERLQEYFERYAAYLSDAPAATCYAIRIGSKTLYAGDTMDLRRAFGRFIGQLKRKHRRSK